MYEKRQGLAVWFRSVKNVRQLRTYGHVQYVSKKMKYAILYCNEREAKHLSERIEHLSFVTGVEWSKRPQLNMDFNKGSSASKSSQTKAENIHV
ncbi:YlbG family protein [Salicibibacter cibi]|uniref:YlbG family protein n=1 Tax=Salicibibacter cibi TaxID=2743001 RepID=A0A7T7CFX5_9BACI|nr:YlbG family protein [Salicibibacter cibi]QQK80627.1 YlbG family protein [Salicibibacter cibi]